MTAPKRIWAAEIGTATKGGQAFRIGRWITDESASHPDEYVRRDPTVIASLPEVQAMVMAERERCARIADGHRVPPSSDYVEGWDASARNIAAAIRAGTDGGE